MSIKYFENTSTQQEPMLHNHSIREVSPENFSIIENPDKTLAYFNDIIRVIKKPKRDTSVFIDIENITNLTIDSVMYLLAIIFNLKRNPLRKNYYAGNYPKNKEVRDIFEDSGFNNYITNHNKIKIEKKGDTVEIKSGKDINRVVAKEICDFVNRAFGTDLKYTKFLYNMIIELMTNTIQHAYNDNNILVNYWYIYVKNDVDAIKFIFLDTGSGIPQTITKKFYENILIKQEYEYILSALRGEFRSNTKMAYRGKGLPKIYQLYLEKAISKLAIISGKGYCLIDNNTIDMKQTLKGTLFYWELKKSNIGKGS